MIRRQFSPLVKHGVTYRTLIIGSVAALTLLQSWGVAPHINPVDKSVLIPDAALTYRQWNDLLDRHDIILGLSWQFATNSSGLLLNSDFNTANNNVYCIGAGGAGQHSQCCFAGGGGGGGAFSTIANFSTHGAGFTVSTQCGTGDTWFNSSGTILAKAGQAATCSAGQGGFSISGVGTTKFSGGNGANGAGPGGGGGGAAGVNGAGGNGSTGGVGGTGDSGNTAASANGTQFDATHGSGGGGAGGTGASAGGVGGSYGGGGGGGGNSSSTGGSGFQGLIAVSYTPIIIYISSLPRRIVYRRY